jgi:poly(3-hydroxybutyrate) depolymerase
MAPTRREMLRALAAAFLGGAAREARADGFSALVLRDLDVRDLSVEGDRALGRRFTLFVPKHLAVGERVPLLVLLHGLGETGDERMGVYAWVERYGLATAYERLRRPPLERTSKHDHMTDADAARLNATMKGKPLRGLAIACPYTPNIGRAAHPAAALDGYARWIAEVVVPRARREAPVFSDPARTSLDGCSLGGFVGLEVFLRRPEVFGAWGGVQSAFGAARAESLAERLAQVVGKVGPRAIHIETSSSDPFREGNVRLSTRLRERGVVHELEVLPGPHNQPWLRELGTLAMLLWHDSRSR